MAEIAVCFHMFEAVEDFGNSIADFRFSAVGATVINQAQLFGVLFVDSVADEGLVKLKMTRCDQNVFDFRNAHLTRMIFHIMSKRFIHGLADGV